MNFHEREEFVQAAETIMDSSTDDTDEERQI